MSAGAALLTATTSSGPQAIDVSPGLALVALIVAGAAALAIGMLLVATRLTPITPGEPTMDLRPETPALVDLLTGGFAVEDDAVPATVLHLAARGWFTIEDQGPDTIIRTRKRRPVSDTLEPYEQRVLDHIEARAINGVVPTKVLVLGPEGASERWFKGFSNSVIKHGQRLGLCKRRWGPKQILFAWLLEAVALTPAILIADHAPKAADPTDWATGGNILLGLAFVVAAGVLGGAFWVSRSGAQRDTPQGVVAAAHWLGVRDFYRHTGEFSEKSASSVAIWDSHLAYATAMGLTRLVRRQIPFETEQDRHAWSRSTGDWRRVKVRYRTIRPGWGEHPLKVAFLALLQGAVAVFVGYLAIGVARSTWQSQIDDYVTFDTQQKQWINLGATIAAVLALAFALHAAIRFVLGCGDLFRHRTVEGDVLRARERGGEDERRYYLAIDTSTPEAPGPESILAYKARRVIYYDVRQGARVSADISPWLGYIRSIRTLVPAPEVPASNVETNDAEQVLASATNWFGGAIGGFAAKLAARQAEHFEHMDPAALDAPDDDGVTPRQRIMEHRSQIEQMLQDPRLANSPARSFFEQFLAASGTAGGTTLPPPGAAPPVTGAPDGDPGATP